MDYQPQQIEKKWQKKWVETKSYKVSNQSSKPKYYILDMFPYPSGAGLHVGHPLGYIASDIFARYKRHCGYNVLHPMGYDAFGLPAEQYAIEHGIHPCISTENNIKNFKNQLDKIGFCYDWDRMVKTCDSDYYKWTQWIFLQLFDSWYNNQTNKTERIPTLTVIFEKEGNRNYPCPGDDSISFSAEGWNSFDEKTRMNILMEYRIAYCGIGEVNWCEALGTVLANDEVVNGVSERGGHPVVKKKLRQWYLRISDYADRLLEGLDSVDFSDSMKEMQTNWIGKSFGAEVDFEIIGHEEKLKIFTTRPDTIFGVDFMVLAPEHELVTKVTTSDCKGWVDDYLTYVNSRSERERMAEKKITGVFSGSYCKHPFSGNEIPIWISEYVLAGYGTGAIMAVPCADERDHKFAKHFSIPITNIIGQLYNGNEANADKEAILENSDFLNGLQMKKAIEVAIQKIEEQGIGTKKVNFKIRDAAFSRQRYWGEPFPIIWKDGVAYPLSESELPLELPDMEEIKPGADAEGPLSNLSDWKKMDGGIREVNTMPGYAGSSWYFLRYMDPENDKEFCSPAASNYWGQVDLYIGGTEHAVGHLLYSRMWTKALYDLGYINHDEPFKKLVNQGMIQGSSRFVYRINGTNTFVSKGFLKNDEEHEGKKLDKLHVDVNFVDGYEMDIEAFKKWRNGEHSKAEFILENGKYICGSEVEKMSKSKFNTVNPDDIVEKFGADCFRMFEMFLGPIEQSKPWETKSIDGVSRFIKRFWRQLVNENGQTELSDNEPTKEELKVLHTCIKKIREDIERFSFNTCVSALMIASNEMKAMNSSNRFVFSQLVVLISPFAPHLAEELWERLGNSTSVLEVPYPNYDEQYLVEDTVTYPICINGKRRAEVEMPAGKTPAEMEAIARDMEIVKKWTEGQTIKKIIIIPDKMVNVVV